MVKITKKHEKVEEPVTNENQSSDNSKDKNDSKHEKSQLEKCNDHDKKIDELTNDLKRLQAEFENYKKRSDKESLNSIRHANANLVKEILPVLDSFELALKDQHEGKPELVKYRKGLELIYTQLYSILESQGLRAIKCDGKFDPFKHEVLMVKESEKDDDTILQELQKGYMLNDVIIRHSKVMISKNVGGK